MNNEKRKKNYRLMKKLMIYTVSAEELEFSDNNQQVEIRTKNICTAELCLCMAIAKRTRSSLYLKEGNIVLSTAIKEPASHYIRWADKHIKELIETE